MRSNSNPSSSRVFLVAGYFVRSHFVTFPKIPAHSTQTAESTSRGKMTWMSCSEKQVGQPVDVATNLSKVKTAQKARRRSSSSETFEVGFIIATALIEDISFLAGASVLCRDRAKQRRFRSAIIPHIRADPEAMFPRARIASACSACNDGLSSA